MADTFQAFAHAVRLAGGGGVDPVSNVPTSGTQWYKNSLGDIVRGTDTSGYIGEWMWVRCDESVTVTPTSKVVMLVSDATMDTNVQSAVLKSPNTATYTDSIRQFAGVFESSMDAGSYGWIRTMATHCTGVAAIPITAGIGTPVFVSSGDASQGWGVFVMGLAAHTQSVIGYTTAATTSGGTYASCRFRAQW